MNTITLSHGVSPVSGVPFYSWLGLLENTNLALLTFPWFPKFASSVNLDVYSTVILEPALTPSIFVKSSNSTSKVQPSVIPSVFTVYPLVIFFPFT